MGVFDSLLGTNTSANTVQGAQLGTSALMGADQTGNTALRKYAGQANDALTSNTQSGLSSLTGGYNSAIGALGSAGANAQNQLAGGVKDATSTVLNSNGAYQPYLAGGQGATSMLSNALGLNGAGGNAAATAAFQTSPGYQFQVDQSTGAAERAAAAGGSLGSGSVLDAVTRLGSNLANGEYSNWLGNLQGLGTQGLNAANSISANNQTAGGYQYGGGSTGAQLQQQLGGQLGTAYGAQGTGQAQLYGNLGSGLSNNLTGLGQGISSNNMNEAAQVANMDYNAGAAQDSAINNSNAATSGIFSKLLGAAIGPTSLSSPSLNVTPSGSGGFSISSAAPAASSLGGSGGFFNSLFSGAGNLANGLGTGFGNAVKGLGI